jgi:Insertion element 4 transposase N-terminal/Transposase DDE domain
MARTKAVLGTGARLSDFLSASLLARVYPADVIHAVLDQSAVNSKRTRCLPALATTYYCMALSLYPEAAYEEVFSVVTQGLAWAKRGEGVDSISKSAISAARRKVGAKPLKALQERACVPLADSVNQPQAFYAGLRLVAIDGSNFEIPDEKANEETFGRPGSRTGRAAYPQAQCAVLAECATHAILGANIGAYRAAEWDICLPLIARLDASMLCLADRGFDAYSHWEAARVNGAQLLWRSRNNRELPVVTALPDGSYLSVIYPTVESRRTRAGEVIVRVIDYALPNIAGSDARYRLLTTLLDPVVAPALELAQIYHERWEVEAVFDELKVHLAHNRRTLRSKKPDGVVQEFYGWVLAHYAVCWLMHKTASEHRLAQRKLSFTGHVHLFRRTQPQSGAFPPSAPQVT